ncbi:hypothetical protein [Actinomadura sp. 3N407]|uniref:hypothetical protein n=1 Tax=Actinomadura sp. 3N407 TaxID=3457423 RepID=UPI003FCC881D
MTGNTPQNRDELLITGIPPVVDPLLAVPGESPRATRPETPVQTKAVFVDATGWRARLGRRLGLGAGAVLVVFLGALGLGMTTGPSVPLTSWSDPSPDPRVEPGTPVMPPANPRERGAASPEPTRQAAARPGGGGQGTAPSAPPAAPPAATPPATPTPASTASHPGRGRSTANPPGWERKKQGR